MVVRFLEKMQFQTNNSCHPKQRTSTENPTMFQKLSKPYYYLFIVKSITDKISLSSELS